MAIFKMVLADPRDGKTYKLELADEKADALLGKNIGDEFETDDLGITGYKAKITGGTDKSGFVMRADLPGPSKRKILSASGKGFTPKIDGQRRRKFIRGSEISQDTSQINAKLVVFGSESVAKLLGLEPEETEGEEAPATEE